MGTANQAVTPGRTTLLDAVNVLLENIGEQPVNTLGNQQIMDARIAERTLLEFHKDGQVKGWSWNSEFDYQFNRDSTTKQIKVPESVVRFSMDPYDYAGRFQLRGQVVYDRENRTTLLGDDIPHLHADVIFLLPWDETPEAYNRWVTIRSARVFSNRVLGSDALYKYTAEDEQAAKATLERMESQVEQANMLTDGRNYNPFPTFAPASGLATRRISAGLRL
jgi:hypothetical protein|tara:strand:+ start:2729 stop:3391 length:663 start_codon:yes stop_codon:yes gene_type:complete